MNVRKRGLALLMCICMIFTLLPFSALADNGVASDAEPPVSVESSGDNGVKLKKTVTKQDDDTYKVTLEQYVTGTVTQGTVTPIDVVLVLDVSGSMSQDFRSTKFIATYDTSNHNKSYSYYVIKNNRYIEVSWCNRCNAFTDGCFNFFGHHHGEKFIPKTSENDNTANAVQFYVAEITSTKMDALKLAVNKFINTIADKNKDSRIAIVTFSDNAIIKNQLTSVSTGISDLRNTVNSLRADGSTAADYGLEKAKSVFSDDTSNTGHQRVVIMFTDGEPNHYNGFDYDVANNAINHAKTLKSAAYGAKVYTIGIFKNANVGSDLPDDDRNGRTNRYMHLVSSNYPTAVSMTEIGTDGAVTNGYYKVASDASTLSDAFTQIGDAVGNPAITLDSSAVLTDVVAGNFTAPANASGVTVYTADYNGSKFADRDDWDDITSSVSVDITGQNVTVSGFDYSANYVSTAHHPDNENDFGKKLIVEFTIEVDRDKTYGGTQPTNAGANIKLGDETVASVADPKVPVSITNGFDCKYENTKPYEEGVGFNIETEFKAMLEKSGLATKTADNEFKNDFVTITYKVTGKDGNLVGTYTIGPKAESGTWTLAENASATTSDAVGTYEYKVTCKVTDANGNAKYKTGVVDGTGTMTLTIYDTYTVTYKYECTDGSDAAESLTPPATMSYRAGTTITVADEPEATALEGYKFIGWYKDGTKIDAGATFNITADTEIIGKWEPVTGLSYVVHYYWVGTEDKVAPDKIVDKQTFGTVITSETPIQVPNYKAVPDQVSNLKISTENEMNVITFYYYKNVELTSNSGNEKYDGTLKTVDGFKAIVAADNDADIYESLKEVLAAHGQGTDAGRYDVYFTKGGEIIPATDLVGRVLNDKYWVTKAEQGKLTISPRSLTITSGSDSKYYDGTPLTNDKITVTGDGFVNGEGATYKVTGSQTEVGSSKNTFDVIFKDNTKATNYVVEKKLGDLTVNRRPMPPVNPPIMDEIIVEITGNSDSVVYDGTEHSVKDYTVKISDPRYTEADFTFTGKAEASGVNAGTYEMGLKAEQFKNTNARFTNVKFVIKADGVLTITPKDLTITAGSKTEYGPTPVTCNEWTVSGLVAGDKVESVKITGIQSVPGSSPNVPSDAVIKNAKGEDVTKNYAIKYVNGTLTMLEVLNKEDHFNYIIGTPEGLSLPTANVTRAEVATIFFRLMTDDARAKFDSLDNNFSDVAKGKWYNRAISTLAKAGIIKGDPAGTYRPGDPITRAEMAAIIARFGDFKEGGKTFNDISGHWAQKYIELAASNGWINGNPDGTFKPNNNITRAETVAMINRVLDRQTKDVSDLLPVAQMTNWSDNMDTAKWYYRDMQEATNNHKAERVGNSIYEKWTEKLPDIDWASYQI